MCIFSYLFGWKSARVETEADDLVEIFPAPTQPEVVYGTRPNVSQSSRAAENFRDQLRQRTAALRQTPQHSDIREKSEAKKPKPNPLPEYDTEKDQYEIEENEREMEFERQLNLTKSENEEKERKLREEKAKNDEHSNLKYQQELENQTRDHEENFKMAQEEIKNFEKETRRLLEQRINEWKANQIALYNYILLQQQFKEQEKSWAEWLESLKISISNVIIRFRLFEKVTESINKSGASYEKILMSELTSLHKSVLPAHEMVCEAWCSVSELAEKVTDKMFLLILQKRFVDISNKLYNVLEVIDSGMIRKEPIDQIYQSFRELSTHDIPTTVQLRDLSKNAKLEDYKKKPEKLMDASEALQKFSDCLQSLTIINDKEVSSELMTDLEVMVEKSEDLRSTITDIIMEIEISLEKGELTKLDGIKEHYETAKVNIEELNTLVPMFDIPATKRLDRVICHQLEILSSAMPQITTENAQKALKNKQITEVLETEVEDRNSQLNDKQLQEQTEIVREEEQMNMLSDLMGTITNFSGLLERDQSDESVQNLVESMRDMFSDLSGLLGEGEEDDDEMKKIRYLLTAIMELTKGTE
ncbi:hypothetical protein GCK72_008099 [Caenorhabditis remanei]|uniref:Uncharacterized protein n=1 Tax=Caenorhabditis remanei TaxID=31234 RepID=A0A6A5HPA7_CAERE|nr:hypothetical protein GCK72_008099 [Caenorhabditis remanei]KAF1768137.1 hypothetical protein GCK72_008099 [Caenorhabditis remanei]